MMLTVLRDKFARSWPRHDGGDRAYVLDAGRALRRTYSTDAHCAGYATPNARRLCGDAVGQVPIMMTMLLVDVDCGATHGSDEGAPEAWRVSEASKVHTLEAEHPGLFTYDSRGGYRIVYALPEPVELHDRDDVAGWSRFYRITLAYLERRFGIVGDGACSDWTRLYRLPRATRNPEAGPEDRAAFGNPDAIGVFTFDPSDEDVRTAEARGKPAPRRVLDLSTPGSVDSGLLYWALRFRGDVGAEVQLRNATGWICRCPNRAQHTVDTDGTTSTVVVQARAGGEIGAIACLHGHCSSLSLRDWLSMFTTSELDAARQAAGIAPRRNAA